MNYTEFYEKYVKNMIDVDGYIKVLPQFPHTENGILFQLYYNILVKKKFGVDLTRSWPVHVKKLKHPKKGRYYMTPRPSGPKDFASTDNVNAIACGYKFIDRPLKDLNIIFKYWHLRDLIFLNMTTRGKWMKLLPLLILIMNFSIFVTKDFSTHMLWWMKAECAGIPELKQAYESGMTKQYGQDWFEIMSAAYWEYHLHPCLLMAHMEDYVES